MHQDWCCTHLIDSPCKSWLSQCRSRYLHPPPLQIQSQIRTERRRCTGRRARSHSFPAFVFYSIAATGDCLFETMKRDVDKKLFVVVKRDGMPGLTRCKWGRTSTPFTSPDTLILSEVISSDSRPFVYRALSVWMSNWKKHHFSISNSSNYEEK